MKTLMIAAIAAAFAVTAAAQGPTPEAKAKQEAVKATTEAATPTGERKAQEAAGVKAAKESKETPKALGDKASKQQAVGSVTKQTAGTQYGTTAAEGSAKAAADTSPRKPKPKPQLQSKEMKEAAKP